MCDSSPADEPNHSILRIPYHDVLWYDNVILYSTLFHHIPPYSTIFDMRDSMDFPPFGYLMVPLQEAHPIFPTFFPLLGLLLLHSLCLGSAEWHQNMLSDENGILILSSIPQRILQIHFFIIFLYLGTIVSPISSILFCQTLLLTFQLQIVHHATVSHFTRQFFHFHPVSWFPSTSLNIQTLPSISSNFPT